MVQGQPQLELDILYGIDLGSADTATPGLGLPPATLDALAGMNLDALAGLDLGGAVPSPPAGLADVAFAASLVEQLRLATGIDPLAESPCGAGCALG